MITYEFLQQYWWFLISVLGALLVFLLFVQGGQTLLCGAKTEGARTMMVNSLGRKWELSFTMLVVFGGAFKMNGARETFEIQKARVEELLGRNFGAPVRTEACLLVCPESPGDFVTGMPGVYLLGEAAGFVSASSFEGISSAIISAKMLADSFETGRDAGGIAREYRRRTRALRGRLSLKIVKRALLCSPLWRRLIMKSGVCSIQVEQAEGHVVAE